MNRSPHLRRARLVLTVIVVAGGAVALVVAISTAILNREDSREVPAEWGVSGDAGPPAIPAEGYAPLDPALLSALEAAYAYEQPDPLAVSAAGLPPVGVYLPVTGDTQFAIPTATPTPAVGPMPTATRTPTATPTPSATPEPTITPPHTLTPPPTLDPTVIALGLGGANCAPAGWPAPGPLTQYFHWYHPAIDIGVPLNTPMVATHSGVVIFAGWRTDGYGNLVIIESGRFITYYAHMTEFAVSQGDIVTQGTVIGWSGSTGNSSGPHIHYEIRIDDVPVNPLTFENRGHPAC